MTGQALFGPDDPSLLQLCPSRIPPLPRSQNFLLLPKTVPVPGIWTCLFAMGWSYPHHPLSVPRYSGFRDLLRMGDAWSIPHCHGLNLVLLPRRLVDACIGLRLSREKPQSCGPAGFFIGHGRVRVSRASRACAVAGVRDIPRRGRGLHGEGVALAGFVPEETVHRCHAGKLQQPHFPG